MKGIYLFFNNVARSNQLQLLKRILRNFHNNIHVHVNNNCIQMNDI